MPDATHTGFTDADGGGYGAGAPVSGVGWLVTGGHLDYASDLASANGGLPPLHSGRTTNEECSTEAFVRASERFTSQNRDDLSGIGRAVKKTEGFHDERDHAPPSQECITRLRSSEILGSGKSRKSTVKISKPFLRKNRAFHAPCVVLRGSGLSLRRS